MALPQNFLDELIYRADIVDVVGRYVHLVKKGSDYWACCPFHNEKTPSFHVNPQKQIFKCFGCGEGGNALQFISKIENLTFFDAVAKLADLCGMTVPEDDYDGGKARARRRRLLELNKEAARWYREVLLSEEGTEARAYLARRGLTAPTVARFGLGYAPDRWDGLLTAMERKGFSRAELEDARLCSRGQKGGLYDFFRDRIMFPVIDVRGDVVAFGGRVLKGDGGGRKYINSPDTLVYSKSRTLYGLNLAKMSKAQRFLLCEGNVDVISLHQAGFDSAVASCGTALTADQARLLSKYTQEVVVIYDADAAGKKATEKAIDILNAANLQVRVLRLPPKRDVQGRVVLDSDGKPAKVDPDDYIRANGADSFRRLLDSPQTDGQYRMAEIRTKYDLAVDEQRIAYLKESASYIASLQSEVEREIFARGAAQEAGVSPESMLLEVRRVDGRAARKERVRREREAQSPVRLIQPEERELRYENPASGVAEENLLAAALCDRKLMEYTRPRVTPEEFSSEFLAKIYHRALERMDAGLELSPAACMTDLEDRESRRLSDILASPVKAAGSREALDDCIAIIKKEYKKRVGGDDDELFRSLTAAKGRYREEPK
ncbi:MAG: DNA primase [Clostridiaceae bacterium]|nr:DNA primase [Clostridiaceae bacterium]